jgi:hypothetical protein
VNAGKGGSGNFHERLIEQANFFETAGGNMTSQIIIRESCVGVEVLTGRQRLNELLAERDEVVVTTLSNGAVVFARLPDGRLMASSNPNHVALFR